MTYLNRYEGYDFGDYYASFTKKEDVDPIAQLIHCKKTLEPSKRDAVYERERKDLEFSISNGLFIKIVRLARNDEERLAFRKQAERVAAKGDPNNAALENENERIVAIAGGYPFNTGKIPIETAKDMNTIKARPAEMGTGLAIHQLDLPNASGEYPKRCFGRFIASAVAVNMFRLAGEEVGGRELNFDSLICTVQKRKELATVLSWLNDARDGLGWSIIEKPSKELQDAAKATTTTAANYDSWDKFYLELPASRILSSANYLCNCCREGVLESDHNVFTRRVHIDIRFDKDMRQFLKTITHPKISTGIEAENSGYSDLRRRISLISDQEEMYASAPNPRKVDGSVARNFHGVEGPHSGVA